MQTDLQSPKPWLFQKGNSGNPAGRVDVRRYREARQELLADFGGEDSLTGQMRSIIDEIAKLKAGSCRRGNDPVRTSRAIRVLMKDLYALKRESDAKADAASFAASFSRVRGL